MCSTRRVRSSLKYSVVWFGLWTEAQTRVPDVALVAAVATAAAQTQYLLRLVHPCGGVPQTQAFRMEFGQIVPMVALQGSVGLVAP